MLLVGAGNKVRLANGKALEVEKLKPGDKVQGQSQVNTVKTAGHLTVITPIWQVNGNLTVTADQLLRTESGAWAAVSPHWAKLENPGVDWITHLQLDQPLLAEEGIEKDIYVDSLNEYSSGRENTCIELELDGDHTFFCNGYLLHNKGGGGGGSTGGTTVSTYQPPAYLEPYLTDIASSAQAAYQQVPQGGFSGQLVARPTTAQTQALDAQKAVAANPALGQFGTAATTVANDLANKVTSGAYTAPLNNTFAPVNLATQDAVNAYLDPVQRRLQNEIVPQLQSQAIAQGAYGGARYNTALAETVNDNFTREAANISAQLGYGEAVRGQDQAFQAWQTNQNLAPELFRTEQTAALGLPSIQQGATQALLTPSSILSGAGMTEQLNEQDLLDEAYNQYLLSLQTPFAGLDQYSSIIAGAPSGGTSTATSTGPRASTGSSVIAGALGGGLGAYGLSQAFPAALGGLGGSAGIAGGAILGGLLGLF